MYFSSYFWLLMFQAPHLAQALYLGISFSYLRQSNPEVKSRAIAYIGPLHATGLFEFGQFGQFGLRIPEESASPHSARRATIERLPSEIVMRAFRFARPICFTQKQIHGSKVVNNPRSKHVCCCSVKLNAADLSKKLHKWTVHMAHPADGVDESCTSLAFATSGVLKGTRINLKVGWHENDWPGTNNNTVLSVFLLFHHTSVNSSLFAKLNWCQHPKNQNCKAQACPQMDVTTRGRIPASHDMAQTCSVYNETPAKSAKQPCLHCERMQGKQKT